MFLQAVLTACGSRPERSDGDLDLSRLAGMRSARVKAEERSVP